MQEWPSAQSESGGSRKYWAKPSAGFIARRSWKEVKSAGESWAAQSLFSSGPKPAEQDHGSDPQGERDCYLIEAVYQDKQGAWTLWEDTVNRVLTWADIFTAQLPRESCTWNSSFNSEPPQMVWNWETRKRKEPPMQQRPNLFCLDVALLWCKVV